MKIPVVFFLVVVALANAGQYKSKRPLVDPLTPPPPQSKIVGGTEAKPHSWPHQVGLFIDDMYFCGGSLISADWVLTAGHCVANAKFVNVVAGAHNINEDEPTQVTRYSTDLTLHENYNGINIHNDVGLIHLEKPFEFNENIQSICYNGGDDPEVGSILTPTGWGLTSDSASGISDVLMQVDDPEMTNDKCAETYGDWVVYEGNICIDASGGHGTCNGDSGGPLHQNGKTYGITSFGSSAGCESGYPDAFTRISYFANWIEEHTGVSPC